jgi:isoleucyl-tRNA synthetase
MSLNGSDVVIALEDVEIIHEDIKGWLVESDGTITVALDTELTPELIEEGFAREFVNRVQNMRKDADFEVMDRIKIYFSGTESLTKALRTFDKYIMNETLAIELNTNFQQGEFSVEDDINGERCSVGIQRVTN